MLKNLDGTHNFSKNNYFLAYFAWNKQNLKQATLSIIKRQQTWGNDPSFSAGTQMMGPTLLTSDPLPAGTGSFAGPSLIIPNTRKQARIDSFHVQPRLSLSLSLSLSSCLTCHTPLCVGAMPSQFGHQFWTHMTPIWCTIIPFCALFSVFD